MLVRAGSAQDPADKPGVAEMVATLLDQGTTTRSAAEIADIIDFMGGGLGTGAGTDLSFANTILLPSNLNEGLQLLADIIRRPAFSAEELERQREQLLSALKVSYQDPDYVAGAVVERLIFGFHPYGKPGNGTPESVAALTRDDLVAFHGRWYHPNNTLIAFVGDVSVDAAVAAVAKAFGDWPKGDGADVDRDRSARPDPAHRRRRSAGRGADRDPRRPARHPPRSPGLHAAQPGGEDPRRRRRQPAAGRAALRSRPHLRRVGRDGRVPAVRGHRRRHRYPDRDDGRGAPPDRRRVHPPAAGGGRASASWTRRRPSSPATSR